MKKYKVTWYEGAMSLDANPQERVLKTIEVEAESIDEANFIQVLPEPEKARFATEIKYCLRTAWREGDLKNATETVSDYGSYSKFIRVVEI